MEAVNLEYCEVVHRLAYLKNVLPKFGLRTIKSQPYTDAGKLITKYKKTKNSGCLREALEGLNAFLEGFDWPTEPRTLATFDDGHLIETHISIDSLLERDEKIKSGYVVLKEHLWTSTHAVTEWDNSLIQS